MITNDSRETAIKLFVESLHTKAIYRDRAPLRDLCASAVNPLRPVRSGSDLPPLESLVHRDLTADGTGWQRPDGGRRAVGRARHGRLGLR